MKNHKGAVAALLTLGLVVVGTLITLGTSLFVNNQNTNFASNSRAANRSCVAPLVEINAKAGSCSQLCGANYSGPTWTENGEYHCCCKSGSGSTNPPPTDGGTSGNVCKSNNGYCIDYEDCNLKVSNTAANTYCRDDNPRDVCCKNPTGPSADDDSDTGNSTSGTVSSNGVPNPEAACCFVSNAQSVNKCGDTGGDYIRVYAHADDRVNSDMSTPCTSDAPPNGYGNAYGASKWFYCADSTVDGCENEAGYDLTEPIIIPPEEQDLIPAGGTCGTQDNCEDGYTCQGTSMKLHTGGKCKVPPAAKCIFDHAPTCTSGGSFKVYKSNSSDCANGRNDNCWGTDNKTCNFTEDDIKGFFTQFCGGQPPGSGAGIVQCSATPTSCTAGDKNKKYYLSVDLKSFYKDAACTNLIEKNTPINLTNYCTGQAGTGLAQNAAQGTNTCKVARESITVNKQTVTIEKANDVFNSKPCDHVLVASTPDNIMVFRECPSFLQGSNCTYSCLKDGKEKNCQGTFDNPQYDPLDSNKAQITIFNNNPTESLSIRVVKNNNDVVINETIIPVGSYTSGIASCFDGSFTLNIKHKLESADIYNLDAVKVNCGAKVITSLDK